MERRRPLIAALAALALVACTEEAIPAGQRLPRALVVAMATDRGAPLTAWLSVVPNSRGALDVRITRGLVVPGPGGLYSIAPESATRRSWTNTELLTNRTVEMKLPAISGWRPVRADHQAIWFTTLSGDARRCHPATGDCEVSSDSPPQVTLTHPGPENGFRLTLTNGEVQLRLPHQADTARGTTVATQVSTLLTVRWLNGAQPPAVQELLDRTFRGAAILTSVPAPIVVDGTLDEWPELQPVVVDAPWQADVRENWTGPKDGSFSVASVHSDSLLCFGGRVRDDVVTLEDTLTVSLGNRRWQLPLDPAASTELQAAVTREWFGLRYELCVPTPDFEPGTEPRHFAMTFRDHDAGTDADILGTAPATPGLAGGQLILLESEESGPGQRAAPPRR